MNRDLFVQSQSEMRANVALQLEWLAPVMLAMHDNVNPTLIDGLTKPHNPGLEYDLFLKWNHLRLDANEAALAAVEQRDHAPGRRLRAERGRAGRHRVGRSDPDRDDGHDHHG